MHNAMLGALGVDGVYLVFDAHPDRAEAVAASIRTLDIAGVNLTVPFKERIVPFLDELTGAARECGAVNTVTQVDGVLTGYNTDGEGLVRSLNGEHGFEPEGSSCLVLGAGGAARAIAGSLAAHGASTVKMLNRTADRARCAGEHLSGFFSETRFDYGVLGADDFESNAPASDLVVNCLGAGAESLVGGFDVSGLPVHAIWADINYWMPTQPLLKECRHRGLRVSDGLGMLAEQGALSFELFTGQPVDSGAMAQAIQTETCSERTSV